MAEILYQYLSKESKEVNHSLQIQWLEKTDFQIFNMHLDLCGQTTMSRALWDEIYDEGTMYAGVFIDGNMIARACVEKYSEQYWEVGDVRVVVTHRNHGYAHEICAFVLNYIISQKKIPTMRTEEKNKAMQKVIGDLGFSMC